MNDAEVEVDDLRIRAIRPLVPSACLIEDVPADAAVYETVGAARTAVELAIRGEDDRLVVIVGPASIHDRAAVLEFAQRLHEAATKLSRELIVVLRAFMDKPAGSAWSGMINDPDLDGSFQINKGFKQARQLLVEVVRLGLPVACEYLDTISPQFVADLISLNTTDSRTSESRLHRELASGLSTPVGFRNASSGDTKGAVDAVREACQAHAFLSVSKQGLAGIVETGGNRDCHVVLHGGSASEETVGAVCAALEAEELPARVMVDCGSGNVPATQAAVAEAVAGRIAGGDTHVFGVALHSFLVSGRQELAGGQAPIYGMSVTEPCLDWSATSDLLGKLAAAVRQRREAVRPAAGPSPSLKPATAPFAELFALEGSDNLRIRNIRPLMPPACVIEELDGDAATRALVLRHRVEISSILHAQSDRLLVVVGPHSAHDPKALMEYAARLRSLAATHAGELLIIMQVQLDKPATGAWSGMINDPDMDGSFQINKGFRQARRLLLDINRLGLAAATKYLDTISPQFVADLISWAVMSGATSESPTHRELASGLSAPVGFRNASSGDTKVAIDAVRESAQPHAFLSVSKQGLAGIVETSGNRDCHVVLQGGSAGPNHSEEAVGAVCAALEAEELPARVMVDCGSHNGAQAPATQQAVAEAVAGRIAGGDTHVFGVALHSFLVSGRQELTGGQAPIYGMSVTEPCLDWSATAEIIGKLAAAVQQRRDLAASAMPPAAKRGRH